MELIKDVAPKQLVPGIIGHYAHGKNMTFGFVEIEAGSDLPAHSHPHEQITYIIEGELDMIIGGEQCKLTPGMYHIIPSNVVHSAVARSQCKLIDVFGPVREEYKLATN